jgi:tetratricopeptide (TPR) repeat protein
MAPIVTRPFRHFGAGGCTNALRWALRTVALAGGVVIMVACGGSSRSAGSAAPREAAPLRTDAEIRELDIAYFTERAERDPTGALDPAHLGALYLARGRETGDPRDALLAEAAARRSLKNRASHNAGAANVLQSALLAQHRFAEALRLAQAARDGDPENTALRAAVGEIQMELGQYDSARVAFTGLRYSDGDLAVLPRVARWAEIEGDTAKARRLLHTALTTALKEPSLPREQVAWYWLRVGDVELRTGHATAADSAYHAGLLAHAGDYRLLSALAHSALVQQRWKEALEYGEAAIATTLDPATLGTLSNAAAALGDTASANEYAHVLDVAVLNQPGAYHRAWSLFLLDHRRHVDVVSRKIREELRTRQDVYAYDLLAWSLHVQGRDEEAKPVMLRALREGTHDALLDSHLAAIDLAVAQRGAAR